MKLTSKLLFTIAALLLVSNTFSLPEFETPVIVKKDNPFNQPYNPRLDNMNDSSADNYQRYKDRRTKGHLTSEMAREFNMDTFKAWIEFTEKENLHELTHPQMIDNVSKILGKSIDLQNFINLKSGLIVKLLGLLDMKLKQLEVLDNTMNSINDHHSDIHSDLYGNAFWKNKLDELLNYSTAINSNYSLDWSTMCEVLGAIQPVTTNIPSSKLVRKSQLARQYHPDQEYLVMKETNEANDDSNNIPKPTIRSEADLNHGREYLKSHHKHSGHSFVEKRSKRSSIINSHKRKSRKH